MPIGTRMRSTESEWCLFRWPDDLESPIQCHAIIWRWISQKRYEI